MRPLISIISPIYNSKAKLAKTLESVLSQSFKNFEYLLMDGNSKDGTQEWASGIKDPRVRLFSESDRGVYDAMNKGIRCAQGRYLYFIGAGDELLSGALQELSQHLPSHNRSVVYGDVIWMDGSIYGGEYSKRKICSSNICHQAAFYGRDVFKMMGHYSLRYPVLADWALNIKCLGSWRIRMRYVPVRIAQYEGDGLSHKTYDHAFHADKAALILRYCGLKTYVSAWRARIVPGTGLLAKVRNVLRSLQSLYRLKIKNENIPAPSTY